MRLLVTNISSCCLQLHWNVWEKEVNHVIANLNQFFISKGNFHSFKYECNSLFGFAHAHWVKIPILKCLNHLRWQVSFWFQVMWLEQYRCHSIMNRCFPLLIFLVMIHSMSKTPRTSGVRSHILALNTTKVSRLL